MKKKVTNMSLFDLKVEYFRLCSETVRFNADTEKRRREVFAEIKRREEQAQKRFNKK